MAENIKQIHHGFGHNIVAGTVNMGLQRPSMNLDVMRKLAAELTSMNIHKVQIEGNSSDESFTAADDLAKYLINDGVEVIRNGDNDTYMRMPGPNRPFTVYTDRVPPLVLIDLTILA